LRSPRAGFDFVASMTNRHDNSEEENVHPSRPKPRSLRRFLVPLLTIILVIALSVVLFIYRHEIERFSNYAYAGVFVVSLLSSATVLIPVPGVVVFLPLLETLNPVLVGVVGAAGSIIGETTAYAAGRSGASLATHGKTYTRVERWMKKRGSLIVFLFAAVPILPMDIAGLVAGALSYPLWKFIVVGLAGKIIKYVTLMLVAAMAVQWLMPWINRFMG
jgi:membrane protein YqaA with SNARE-associated domain